MRNFHSRTQRDRAARIAAEVAQTAQAPPPSYETAPKAEDIDSFAALDLARAGQKPDDWEL